jgi:hypothetical protein
MTSSKSGSRARTGRAAAKKVAGLPTGPVGAGQVVGKDWVPQASERADALATAEALKRIIEEERARLMSAESILECAMLAMDETDHEQANGPYYQNVIGVARDLILKSIDQLDSVRLAPILQRLALGNRYGVREYIAVYLH